MPNYPAQRSRVLSRDGIQQRRNSWQDGVAGTNCPIPSGQSWTYHFKPKDQIGSYFYYPSLLFQKAAGGFGSIRINPRSIIPSPFAPPADDFVVLIGDWYKTDHKVRLIFISIYEKKHTFTSMWWGGNRTSNGNLCILRIQNMWLTFCISCSFSFQLAYPVSWQD